MLVQQFMRIPEFSHLPPAELRALAARSHVICVPAQRQVIRPGTRALEHMYLLRGKLLVDDDPRGFRAGRLGRLRAFYPGCVTARTLSPCQILRVDAQAREFALHRCGAQGLMLHDTSETWLQRFLSSHMMRQLSAGEWQRILSAFRGVDFNARERIVSQGAPALDCYVVESGRAVVHVGNETLCHLNPGDFFGEDALLLNGPRNADVTALSALRVRAIPGRVFCEVLVGSLVQFVDSPKRGRLLRLHGAEIPGESCVALQDIRAHAAKLDPKVPVYIVGDSRRARALAAFLLIQKGLRAYPVGSTGPTQLVDSVG